MYASDAGGLQWKVCILRVLFGKSHAKAEPVLVIACIHRLGFLAFRIGGHRPLQQTG